ncbi:hypothetical protein V2G26_006735 [Clonostachys chloroleuca]
MAAPLGDWGMNLNAREVLSFLGMWCPFLEDAIFLHLHWPPIIDAISPGRYRKLVFTRITCYQAVTDCALHIFPCPGKLGASLSAIIIAHF